MRATILSVCCLLLTHAAYGDSSGDGTFFTAGGAAGGSSSSFSNWKLNSLSLQIRCHTSEAADWCCCYVMRGGTLVCLVVLCDDFSDPDQPIIRYRYSIDLGKKASFTLAFLNDDIAESKLSAEYDQTGTKHFKVKQVDGQTRDLPAVDGRVFLVAPNTPVAQLNVKPAGDSHDDILKLANSVAKRRATGD